jgi:hypothetical protein
MLTRRLLCSAGQVLTCWYTYPMRINAKATVFFDRLLVTTATDRALVRQLRFFGMDTRREARRMIKRNKAGARLAKIKQQQREFYRSAGLDTRSRNRAAKRLAKRAEKARHASRVTSRPGQPPMSQSRADEIRRINYSYDSARRSVVVGYMKWSAFHPHTPKVLEYGGIAMWRQPGQAGVNTSRLTARPAIGPAGQKAMIKFRQRLKDSIK